MLSFPFLFSLFSFLVTYLSRGTHSSAIVFSDGDDLGFNSDSGGGVGGGGLELDMDLDMDLDRDLMASSSMDDDDDDDSLFAMTNLGEYFMSLSLVRMCTMLSIGLKSACCTVQYNELSCLTSEI